MDIERVPETCSVKSRIVSFAVDEDTFKKLEYLRTSKNKSTSALLRLLLTEFFEENSACFSMDLPRGK